MDREQARDKIIVAMDFPSAKEALELDRKLGSSVRWVKVGLQLYTAEGPAVVAALKERGRSIFLDLKLHDIPQTVKGAVKSAAAHGVDLMTLHAEGGPAMMEAAAEARDAAGSGARLLAVTVLTSLSGNEFPEIYQSSNPQERVRCFAEAARDAGVDGVVCSPLELDTLSHLPSGFLRVTPGIRPRQSEVGDQVRIATPESALRGGATHLVIGRPITQAPDPEAAVNAIVQEIESASVS